MEGFMIRRVAFVLQVAALGLACAAAIQLAPPPPDHPASPQAAEAAFVDAASVLRPDAQDATRTTTPAGVTVYTCPMHPEILLDEPGACPKCGMTLILKDGSQ